MCVVTSVGHIFLSTERSYPNLIILNLCLYLLLRETAIFLCILISEVSILLNILSFRLLISKYVTFQVTNIFKVLYDIFNLRIVHHSIFTANLIGLWDSWHSDWIMAVLDLLVD